MPPHRPSLASTASSFPVAVLHVEEGGGRSPRMSPVCLSARRDASERTRVNAGRSALRLAVAALTLLGLLANGGDGIDEYQLKAAFLSKFVKYVTWPSERTSPKDAPFVMGVLGTDPFGARLDETFKGRKLDDHPIVVRRLAGFEGIASVHVLFVPGRETKHLEQVIALTAGAGVLLVGESSDFALDGGVINFYVEGGKLRFEINTDSAKRQKLRVSSDLLKLARIVGDRE